MMDTRLQELTDKLYAEGVEKGNEQAAAIVNEAEQKAAQIIEQARAEASRIVDEANRKAQELDKNTRSELRLFANQSVSALKTEITNLLNNRLASDSVKAATADKAFMQKLIADLVAQLAKDGSVVVEAKDAELLKQQLASQAKDLLAKKIEIKEVKGIKTDFVITPQQGGYKLEFGDDQLVEYFKEYLRPQLIELLF